MLFVSLAYILRSFLFKWVKPTYIILFCWRWDRIWRFLSGQSNTSQVYYWQKQCLQAMLLSPSLYYIHLTLCMAVFSSWTQLLLLWQGFSLQVSYDQMGFYILPLCSLPAHIMSFLLFIHQWSGVAAGISYFFLRTYERSKWLSWNKIFEKVRWGFYVNMNADFCIYVSLLVFSVCFSLFSRSTFFKPIMLSWC